jgi:hypothetical protein
MKKRITVLLAALMLALSMSFGSMALAGTPFHGCKHGSQGKKASHGKCHHHGKKGNHNGNGGNGGGDDGDDDD